MSGVFVMRVILGCVAVLALAVAATAAGQAKVDAKLLVGKWEQAPDKDKKEKPPAMVIEFTADGKLSMIVGDTGKEFRVDGKYTLEVDKLAVVLKLADKEIKETLTVKKLTSTELVTEDSKNKTETLRKKQ
jgi:uncharacterized protein (TIGR03066 family)